MKKNKRNYKNEIVAVVAMISTVIFIVALVLYISKKSRVDDSSPMIIDLPECEQSSDTLARSLSFRDVAVPLPEEDDTMDTPFVGKDPVIHSRIAAYFNEAEPESDVVDLIPSDDWYRDITKLREERRSKIVDYLLHDSQAFRLEVLGASFIAFLILVLTWICTVIARRPKTVVRQTVIKNDLPDDLLRRGDVIESVSSDYETQLNEKYGCPNTGHATFVYWAVRRIESGEDFSKVYADDALKLLIEGRIRDIRDYDKAAEYFRCNPLPESVVKQIVRRLTGKNLSPKSRKAADIHAFHGSDTL